eukprot:SAG11_NODE_6971_length_1216_cov_3.235452_1_plen_86_part_01
MIEAGNLHKRNPVSKDIGWGKELRSGGCYSLGGASGKLVLLVHSPVELLNDGTEKDVVRNLLVVPEVVVPVPTRAKFSTRYEYGTV